MESPCFDKKTKTDCPDRHKGCANTCSRWATYVSERDKEYQRRRRMSDANGALIDSMSARTTLRYKYAIKDRQYKTKRRD